MIARLITGASAAVLALLLPVCGFAQQPLTHMGGLVVSGWVGGAANTDLQRTQAMAQWLTSDGGLASRQFARRLSAETSVAFGVGVSYWFNRWLGVRGQTGLSPTQLEISVSERETAGIPVDTVLTGASDWGSMHVWTYDAALLVRAPFTPRGRIAPYGFVGAGRIEYNASRSDVFPPEARSSFAGDADRTRTAILLGLGAIVPLQRDNLALSFELSSHFARTPVESTTSTRLSGTGVQVITAAPAGGRDGDVETTAHVRLLIGVSWFAR